MADVLYVILTVGAFALAVGLVGACDRLVGPDGDDLDDVVETAAGTGVAAAAPAEVRS